MTLWLRVGLGYLTVVNGVVGIWAAFFPRSFFDDFPGAGMTWVSTDGPYNEHLVRDVGAWSLGITVVIVTAMWLLSRTLVVMTGVAVLVSALPHAIYHTRHAEVIGSTLDQVQAVGALYLAAAVGAAVAVAGRNLPDGRDQGDASAR